MKTVEQWLNEPVDTKDGKPVRRRDAMSMERIAYARFLWPLAISSQIVELPEFQDYAHLRGEARRKIISCNTVISMCADAVTAAGFTVKGKDDD